MTHGNEEIKTLFPEKRGGDVSALMVFPDGLEFETQNVNEHIFIMLRMHIITNSSWIFSALLSCFLPLIVSLILGYFHISISADIIKPSYVIVFLFLWYLLTFTYTFLKFLNWFFNVYIVTNERILDFDFNPMTMYKISEANLENIEDATQQTIGLLPSLFNYGDIYIQTAAERREFEFVSVPNPSWVRDKIMDLKNLVVRSK